MHQKNINLYSENKAILDRIVICKKTLLLFLRDKDICDFCDFCVISIRANSCQFVFESYPCFLCFLYEINDLDED